MKRTLGPLETQLFAYCHMRGIGTIRTGDLRSPLHISDKQERELLSRMARSGLIAKVRRGLYLIPSRLPLGGIWSPSSELAINTLMEDRSAIYQVCGPNAFNHYGFDEQVPNRIYAYNDKISGVRTIGTVELSLIKVAPDRLGSTVEINAPSGVSIVYSSRARTLVDAVHDWSRFDTLPRAYSWIRQELDSKRVSAKELAKVTVKYGNQGTVRRIGAALERFGGSGTALRTLEQSLRSPKSVIAADPRSPRSGPKSKRWGVILYEE
ncbi:MAG: hypothetical protein GY906_12125 [bacterium]|nr:hypothetical protein [bacterium]